MKEKNILKKFSRQTFSQKCHCTRRVKPSLPADIKTGIAPLALIARNGTYIKQPAFYSSFRNGGVTTMEDQNGSMA